MGKRLFIAINLPDNLKKYLDNLKFKWAGQPKMRWVKTENLHLTLIFIGYLEIGSLPMLIAALQKSSWEIFSQKLLPTEIKLKEVVLGPNSAHPRLIWVTTHPNPNLTKIKRILSDNLSQEKIFFQEKSKQFIPHLTLARFNCQPKKFESEKISWQFSVKSFELMESNLRRGGAEYNILKSFSD